EEFGIYLSGGIGASRFEDLITVTGPTNTYQVGAGFEIYFEKNFAIGASFAMLIPGVSSIETTVTKQALSALETFDAENPPEMPSIGDFLSIENFRVSITSQYYF